MLAGILGSQLLPAVGWRTLFVAGGVAPLVAAAVLTRLLPESPRFLAHEGPRAPLSTLFSPEFRRDTIALWCSFSSCLLAVYLGFSWLPTVLAGAGFGPNIASTGITAFNLGGVVGALASGAVMSRIGSRKAMLTMAVGAIGGAITLSTMTISIASPLAPLMAMLTITGGLINAIQTTMYALATNVYPAVVRAAGVGAATAVGRLGAILSGYAGPWALGLGGSTSYFWLIAVAMVGCLIALASVRRHVERRISPEPS
jgi:AAHS family 4-hydroxybenzoate transporter-like MFS transporter